MALKMSQIESTYVKMRGLTAHVRRSKKMEENLEKPLIVLVHGVGVSSRYLLPLAEVLAKDFRVLIPDLPGFGMSGKPEKVLGIKGLSDSLFDILKRMGVERAHFFGNSVGCQILADFAIDHPDVVETVIFQGPTVNPEARSMAAQMKVWFKNSRAEGAGLAPILLLDSLDCGLGRLVKSVKYAIQDKIEDKLPHIQVPALVIRGAKDSIVPQKWAQQVVEFLPQGQLEIVPGGSHTLNYFSPEQVATLIRKFLRVEQPLQENQAEMQAGMAAQEQRAVTRDESSATPDTLALEVRGPTAVQPTSMETH